MLKYDLKLGFSYFSAEENVFVEGNGLFSNWYVYGISRLGVVQYRCI